MVNSIIFASASVHTQEHPHAQSRLTRVCVRLVHTLTHSLTCACACARARCLSQKASEPNAQCKREARSRTHQTGSPYGQSRPGRPTERSVSAASSAPSHRRINTHACARSCTPFGRFVCSSSVAAVDFCVCVNCILVSDRCNLVVIVECGNGNQLVTHNQALEICTLLIYDDIIKCSHTQA